MTRRIVALVIAWHSGPIALANADSGGGLDPPSPRAPAAEPAAEASRRRAAQPAPRSPRRRSRARSPDDPRALGDPRGLVAHERRVRGEGGQAPRSAPRDSSEREPWRAPRAELGYGYYQLATGYGPGAVHSAFFGGFLPFGHFRAEATGEFGRRDYSLGDPDTVLRGAALLGYQHLQGFGRVVPYAGIVGTLGVVFGTRYRTSFKNTLLGGGLEIGADLRLFRKLLFGIGFGYLRAGLGDATHNLFLTRIRIGL